MDSFEFNKIAGAVLAALLLAFGTSTAVEIAGSGHGGDHQKVGYKLPVETAAANNTAPDTERTAEFDPQAVVVKLASASADNGKSVFARCQSCHTVDKGGAARAGPNLWGVVGSDIASSSSFDKYSNALKDKPGAWDYERLVAYLYDPRRALPGNRMAFAGVKNLNDLADVVAYLRTLADTPTPLPQ